MRIIRFLIPRDAPPSCNVSRATALYQRAMHVAERAATDLEPHTHLPDASEMLGQLYVLNGFARYSQGDIAGADAAVAEAMKLARITGQSDALGLYFGPTNVTFWQVGMQASAGDPADAVRAARGIDPTAFATIGRSRRIAFYIDTAHALASLRKDREALRMLLAAEREAPQRVRLSPIVASSVRGMLERSRRGTGWSELRGLCERMDIPL